jgi:hypothetical protein
VRVANGSDEEGFLVFDVDRRLLAVLVHLSNENEVAPGHWFLETGFGPMDGPDHPSFVDLDEAQEWVRQRLIGSRQPARGSISS